MAARSPGSALLACRAARRRGRSGRRRLDTAHGRRARRRRHRDLRRRHHAQPAGGRCRHRSRRMADAQLGGVAGRLAQQNAARNPRRTATTAAALMIGLTLVSTALVVGDSVKATIGSTFERVGQGRLLPHRRARRGRVPRHARRRAPRAPTSSPRPPASRTFDARIDGTRHRRGRIRLRSDRRPARRRRRVPAASTASASPTPWSCPSTRRRESAPTSAT